MQIMRTYHNKGKRIVLENPFVIGNTLETKSTEIKSIFLIIAFKPVYCKNLSHLTVFQ